MPDSGFHHPGQPHRIDPFDRWIDEALASYSMPPPGAEINLPARILAHLAAQTQPTPSRWLRLRRPAILRAAGIAIPIAACLLLLLPFIHRKNATVFQPAHPANPLISSAPSSGSTLSAPSPALTRSHNFESKTRPVRISRPIAAEAVASLPKLDVFPTPRPLNSSEQALVVYLAHASESEIQSLASITNPARIKVEKLAPIDSINISAIQIPLIPPPTQGSD
jgi:hypothetical protein